MSQKFGVKININATFITAWASDGEYDYVVICEQVSERQGNGLCRIKIYDDCNNHQEITDNGWSIFPVIDSPFNWTGSSIKPKIRDPKGYSREIFVGNYSQTIFKGLSYHKDITALFNVLKDYSSFSSWCEFDMRELEKQKNEVIHMLQLEIINLKNQLKLLKG